ncbi:arachidonate 5-lipoxygenase-activating protein isoform X1 [Petaurus breviceps papuanus]|uniref:arachidonate 5-lipoxygenase-activating protein isoform X1 n=1 Tax=Petaurus breviceps papuanus TaxID=3040969 RepID=UPI0036DC77D9
MDHETVGNIVLLAIVTLISAVQNGFFAHKVEHESRSQNVRSFQRTGTFAFERVYTANQNCIDAYPTFLVMLWSAGLLCSQVPAAFAGLMYLFVRQKYFVGYLGERTQRNISCHLYRALRIAKHLANILLTATVRTLLATSLGNASYSSSSSCLLLASSTITSSSFLEVTLKTT